jgi:hypothetical protein
MFMVLSVSVCRAGRAMAEPLSLMPADMRLMRGVLQSPREARSIGQAYANLYCPLEPDCGFPISEAEQVSGLNPRPRQLKTTLGKEPLAARGC